MAQNNGSVNQVNDLKSTMDHLPELMNKKRIITSHFEMISSLAKTVETRKIDKLIEFEDKMSKYAYSNEIHSELLQMLSHEQIVDSDKLRLAIYFILCYKQNLTDPILTSIFERIKHCENSEAFSHIAKNM